VGVLCLKAWDAMNEDILMYACTYIFLNKAQIGDEIVKVYRAK